MVGGGWVDSTPAETSALLCWPLALKAAVTTEKQAPHSPEGATEVPTQRQASNSAVGKSPKPLLSPDLWSLVRQFLQFVSEVTLLTQSEGNCYLLNYISIIICYYSVYEIVSVLYIQMSWYEGKVDVKKE